MKYYAYQVPLHGSTLIGTEKEQIRKTLEYYVKERGDKLDMPEDSDIFEPEEININAVLPLAKIDQNLRAEVRDNVIFWVNSNAFEYIQEIAKNYEKLRRGELFKYDPGVSIFGLFFLPEYIMQGLREYNWEQHREQVNEWLGVRERDLNEAERRGHVHRVDLSDVFDEEQVH